MTDNLSQTYEQPCSDTLESPHLPQPSITSLLTNQLLEKIVKEVRKKENMDKIHGSIIDPLIQYTYNKIYPYILILFGVLILIFLIIVVILLLILRPRFFNRIR
jgi:hypothetical protein